MWCWTGEICVEELKRLREIPGLGGDDSAHLKRCSRALSARCVGGGEHCCCLEGLFGTEGRRALSRSGREEGDRSIDCRSSRETTSNIAEVGRGDWRIAILQRVRMGLLWLVLWPVKMPEMSLVRSTVVIEKAYL
jgi:hypothetical protein